MFLLIILILFFYHWLFVSFTDEVKKPPMTGKYVDLNGNLYENDRIISTTKDAWDYKTQTIAQRFDFDIQSGKDEVRFTSMGKEWKVPLTSEYHWTGDQIAEKDDCFGKKSGNVPAVGKKLFDYSRHHELTDASATPISELVYRNVHLFYFKCKNGKIKELHKCPPGSTFEITQCVSVDNCRDKKDGFTYADFVSKFDYFECQKGKSFKKKCPPKEIFQHDKCNSPDNICEVETDGHKIALDKYRYGECIRGKMVMRECNAGYYFLDNQCEYEKCFEKDDEKIATRRIVHGPFELYPFYGTCKKGKLVDVKQCPSDWDASETAVNIAHLPKVFANGQCVEPKLCENVQLIDDDAVVPAYHYTKHLATWSNAFDRTHGFNCKPNLQSVSVPHGSLITNYKIVEACDALLEKVPTTDPRKYYDCASARLNECPADSFFDGTTCKKKNLRAFRFNDHLDVFEFDGLGRNNWMRARPLLSSQPLKTCDPTEKYVRPMDMCVHQECGSYLFIRELQRSVKLDDRHQCSWINNKIVKETYHNPKKLKLKFWKQKLTSDDSIDICTEGARVETGNFVLDSTLYTTCRADQAFVFCPSNATRGIEKVGDYFACRPDDTVYSHFAPKLDKLDIYFRNEIDKIVVPQNTAYRFDTDQPSAKTKTVTELTVPPMSRPNHLDLNFKFNSSKDYTVHFRALVNNPPNTYILNRKLMELHDPTSHYDVTTDAGSWDQLQYHDYALKDYVTNFVY